MHGVIFEVDLMECSESEILGNLADRGVAAVKRIRFLRNKKDLPAKRISITFSMATLPHLIKAGGVPAVSGTLAH